MSPAAFAGLLTAVATGTLVLTLGFGLEWLGDFRRQRFVKKQLTGIKQSAKSPETAAALLLRDDVKEDPAWVVFLIERVPLLRSWQRLLRQAGLNWSVRTLLLFSVLWAAFLGLSLNTISERISLPLVGAFFGAIGPTFYVRIRKRRRVAKFEQQFPDAIELLARALRAGHPLSAGFKVVGDESPEPLGGEFRRIFEEQRFGINVEESLNGLIERIDLLDVRMLVTAVLIQREVGGNLAEILDGLGNTIRERFLIVSKLQAFTAQSRLSGYVLAGLPVILGGALFLLNPPYIMVLFTEPLGRVMLGMGVTMQTVGYLWIRSIVDVKY